MPNETKQHARGQDRRPEGTRQLSAPDLANPTNPNGNATGGANGNGGLPPLMGTPVEPGSRFKHFAKLCGIQRKLDGMSQRVIVKGSEPLNNATRVLRQVVRARGLGGLSMVEANMALTRQTQP